MFQTREMKNLRALYEGLDLLEIYRNIKKFQKSPESPDLKKKLFVKKFDSKKEGVKI